MRRPSAGYGTVGQRLTATNSWQRHTTATLLLHPSANDDSAAAQLNLRAGI
jgi:hypothetical protein